MPAVAGWRLEEKANLRMGPAELKQAFSALGVKLPNSSKAFQQVSCSCPMFPSFPVSSGFTSPSDRLRSGVGVGLSRPLAVERNPVVCPRAWVALILAGTQARLAAPSGAGPVMRPWHNCRNPWAGILRWETRAVAVTPRQKRSSLLNTVCRLPRFSP